MFFVAVACSLLVGIGGCATDNGPANMGEADLKKAVDSATPQQQIDWYKRSPMPTPEKAKKIADIEAKYGIKDSSAGAPAGAGG